MQKFTFHLNIKLAIFVHSNTIELHYNEVQRDREMNLLYPNSGISDLQETINYKEENHTLEKWKHFGYISLCYNEVLL